MSGIEIFSLLCILYTLQYNLISTFTHSYQAYYLQISEHENRQNNGILITLRDRVAGRVVERDAAW